MRVEVGAKVDLQQLEHQEEMTNSENDIFQPILWYELLDNILMLKLFQN